jgi:transposase
MRVEVFNGVERRRRWTRDEKARVLAESLEPGARVAEVARRNDVAQSVLFSWRRAARVGNPAPPAMVPVIVAEPEGAAPRATDKARRGRGPAKARGLIEIDLGGGRCVRVDSNVDGKALGLVLDVLNRR